MQRLLQERLQISLAPHVRRGSILYVESECRVSFGRLASPELGRKAFLNEILSLFTALVGNDGHVIFSYLFLQLGKHQ